MISDNNQDRQQSRIILPDAITERDKREGEARRHVALERAVSIAMAVARSKNGLYLTSEVTKMTVHMASIYEEYLKNGVTATESGATNISAPSE